MVLTSELRAEFDELCTHYPQRRAALIPALHRCQEELGGWLSPETLESVAEYFELQPVEVYAVASFYPMFFLKPIGKNVISVCRNISCDLRGSTEITAAVKQCTGAGCGETSEDGRFYVEEVECQGACTNAPMMVVNGQYHEDLTPEAVVDILGGCQ